MPDLRETTGSSKGEGGTTGTALAASVRIRVRHSIVGGFSVPLAMGTRCQPKLHHLVIHEPGESSTYAQRNAEVQLAI